MSGQGIDALSVGAHLTGFGRQAVQCALDEVDAHLASAIDEIDLGRFSRILAPRLMATRGSLLEITLPNLALGHAVSPSWSSLSVRGRNVLGTLGVVTAQDLGKITIGDLYAQRNCGETTVQEIAAVAIELHLRLAPAAIAVGGPTSILDLRSDSGPAELPTATIPLQERLLGMLGYVFSCLGPWAVAVRDARTVGDVLRLDDRLESLPPDLQPLVDELLALRIDAAWRPRPSSFEAEDVLCGLDERERLAFELHELADPRTPYAELGRMTTPPLTVERMRQICLEAQRHVRSALASPDLQHVLWSAHELARSLGAGAPVDSETFARAMQRMPAGLTEKDQTLLLWAAGPYTRRGGWILRDGCGLPVYPARDRVPISDRALTEWIVAAGFREDLLGEVAAASSLRRLGDDWYLWRGSVADKAAAVMSVIGRPAEAGEICDLIAEGHNERGVRNSLGADYRFVKVDFRNWALRDWGLPEYEGIVQAIRAAIEQCGGSAVVADVVSSISSRFGVADASVRAYAEAPMFVLSEGRVRLRREDEGFPVDARVHTVQGLFPDPDQGLVHFVLAIDTEIERGSGRPLRPPMGYALDVSPGCDRTFQTSEGHAVTVTWPLTSAHGPTLGSTRLLARTCGASVGDLMLVSFDVASGDLRGRRIAESATDLVELTGLSQRVGERPQMTLARSLGCAPHQVRSHLLARGDHQVARTLGETGAQDTLPLGQ